MYATSVSRNKLLNTVTIYCKVSLIKSWLCYCYLVCGNFNAVYQQFLFSCKKS